MRKERRRAGKPRFSLPRWFGVRRSSGFLLLLALAALRIFDPLPVENLRLRSFDYYQVLKPRVAELRPVVIVDLDEQSIRELGQWPWPRTLLADLVTRLSEAGAAAIGFDIIFAELDRMSPRLAAEALRDIDDATREKLRALPGNDDIFAAAIRDNRVILGQSGVAYKAPSPAAEMPQTGIAMLGPDPAEWLFTFAGLLRNVPELEQAAAGRGLLTIRNERDGIVRRVPMVVKAGDIVAPALTLEMLRVATQSGAILIKGDDAGIHAVGVSGLELPTDHNGQIYVHFAPHDPARYVAAKDVLAGRVSADVLEGKLVLIGTSAAGLLDIKTTPLDAAIPGVEVHAQLLEAALTGATLSHPTLSIAGELSGMLFAGSAITILAPLLGAVALFLVAAGTAAAMIAAAWHLFAQHAVLFDLTFPLASLFLLYVLLTVMGYVREQKDRRRIRSAFSQYLSPALVEQLAQSPEKLVLGGEERIMTVMFSDVRGFTRISESYRHDPQGLTQLMNRFLTPLTHAIIERRGTIDKYMGDAVMAFWNAPIDDAEHEANACRAALDMLRRIETLNAEREDEARRNGARYIPIRMGIGINTGTCVVGNMGSDLRFDYSVLGDAVNLASRIEGLSKPYGAPIILGSRTAGKVRDAFALLELDLITVKGKSEPERIYALLGAQEVASRDDFRKLDAANARMLACYRNGDWTGALNALKQCRAMANSFGLDEVYQLYLARIERFKEAAPPPGWDGVYAAETK